MQLHFIHSFHPEFYAVSFHAQPFPGNIVPANRVSPAGKAILQNFLPSPAVPGIFNGRFNNFTARQTFRFGANTVDGRLDHSFSDKDRLSGVYHYGVFDSTGGSVCRPYPGGGMSHRWVNEFRLYPFSFR